jgi:hypothetical protein
MLKRILSLATALLLSLALGAGPAATQVPSEGPSGGAAGASAAQEVSQPDSTRIQEEAADQAGAESGEGGVGREAVESDTVDADEGAPAEPEPGAVSPSGLRVLRAYICKGIEQSEPTEAGKSFIPAPDGVLRLCCFSEIGGPAQPDTVSHIWYWGDREMARVPLHVEGARWRTWSTKRIIDEWRGDWRVDIIDRDGFVLARLPFSIE